MFPRESRIATPASLMQVGFFVGRAIIAGPRDLRFLLGASVTSRLRENSSCDEAGPVACAASPGGCTGTQLDCRLETLGNPGMR